MARTRGRETQALGRAIREVRVECGFTQESFRRKSRDRIASYHGAIERGEFNVTPRTIYEDRGWPWASVQVSCWTENGFSRGGPLSP